jgi:hypothetical protein
VSVIVLSARQNVNDAYEEEAMTFIPKATDLSTTFSNIKVLLNFWFDAAKLPQKPERGGSNWPGTIRVDGQQFLSLLMALRNV